MTPYLNVMAQSKIYKIIESCVTMEDTGNASKVIDSYQSLEPNEKEYIHDVRNLLCDKTFDIYLAEHK